MKYQRQYIEQRGLGKIHEVTRAELKDRLIDWFEDPEVTIADMEAHPGEWVCRTAFAYYRAVTDVKGWETR